jgi:hypothetical protein
MELQANIWHLQTQTGADGVITEQFIAAGNFEYGAVKESLNLTYLTEPNGIINTICLYVHLCDSLDCVQLYCSIGLSQKSVR